MNSNANTFPKIKSLHFQSNCIELFLVDGRIISAPLSKFPELKKLSAFQRNKYHIMAGLGFDFDDSDEVYHISEFLEENNSQLSLERKIKPFAKHKETRSSLVAEDSTLYRKRKIKLGKIK